MRAPALAPAGMPPRRVIRDRVAGCGTVLAFDANGYRRGDGMPPPRRPVRRGGSPAARAWSWIMVALLVAALVLPFSLAALVDLARYLER